jgi:hypothetical protein
VKEYPSSLLNRSVYAETGVQDDQPASGTLTRHRIDILETAHDRAYHEIDRGKAIDLTLETRVQDRVN